jgi:dTDP-4-dehydrorhamnose reductase
MKIIITGGKGLLATNILPVLGSGHDIIVTDAEPGEGCATNPRTIPRAGQVDDASRGSATLLWDISDREQGEQLIASHRPDAIVNLAAITNVDGCEDNVELARKVNGEAPGILAELCKQHGVRLLHISTDYVFDGETDSPCKEGDRPNPQSVYGATKLLGETKVMAQDPSALIVRIQWLYGDGGENFITKIKRIAEKTGVVDVVNDQRGAPTYARDLAYPIRILLERGKSGIYHIANAGSCTWFEFAQEIFSQLGMDVQVRPITSTQLNRKAKRPACAVYDCTKLQKDTGILMRSWKEALRDYLGAQANL